MATLKLEATQIYKLALWMIEIMFILTEGVDKASSEIYGIELAVGSSNLLTLEDGGSAIVNFVYSAKNKPDVIAFLDTNKRFPVSIDTKKREGMVFIDSKNLKDASTDFGTYLLTLVLTDEGVNYTKEMVLFYEEPIEGFSVTPNSFEHYPNQDIKVDVALKRGSNVDIEWLFDHSYDSCLITYDGPIRHVQNSLRFDRPGFYNVSVIAANDISRTYVNVLIVVRHRQLTFLNRLKEASAKIENQLYPSFQTITVYPKMIFKVR